MIPLFLVAAATEPRQNWRVNFHRSVIPKVFRTTHVLPSFGQWYSKFTDHVWRVNLFLDGDGCHRSLLANLSRDMMRISKLSTDQLLPNDAINSSKDLESTAERDKNYRGSTMWETGPCSTPGDPGIDEQYSEGARIAIYPQRSRTRDQRVRCIYNEVVRRC